MSCDTSPQQIVLIRQWHHILLRENKTCLPCSTQPIVDRCHEKRQCNTPKAGSTGHTAICHGRFAIKPLAWNHHGSLRQAHGVILQHLLPHTCMDATYNIK